MFSHTSKIAVFILFLSLLAIVILQFHNLPLFRILRGFDAKGHLQYIEFLAQKQRFPLPFEGWEMYQPPLYYLTMLLLSPWLQPKAAGLIIWLILLYSTYKFFKQQFKTAVYALTGTLLVVSLPAVLYSTFAVSNEFFSAVLISLTLIYYSSFYNPSKIKSKIILGSLIGFSLLAKATALILILAIALSELISNKWNINKTISKLTLPLGLTFLLSGWFYFRNFILYGNLFTSSYDFPGIFPLTQLVVPRNLVFFFSLKGFLNLDLFRAHHYSFLAGTFFSWFYDGHNVIVPVQAYSKIGIILVFLSLPIFVLSLKGYFNEWQINNKKNYLFLLYPLLLLLTYILYNFRLPYYSTVKGIFLISSIIPFAYFFLKGCVPFKKGLALYIALYSLVLLRCFWIQATWYF